jgi:hypothetical protein
MRALPVGLRGMAAIAVALAKLAQGVGQLVHRGLSLIGYGSEKQGSVFLPTR